MYMGNPELRSYMFQWWDTGRMSGEGINIRGAHKIWSSDRNPLEWKDVKDGMYVRIEALNNYYRDYKYLYASTNGKYKTT